MPLPSPAFWFALAAGLLCMALLWWQLIGARRARRLRQLDAAIRSAEAAQGSAGTEWPARLDAGMAKGAGRSLYERPWTLFLTDPATHFARQLAEAGFVAPPSEPAPDAFWRWWSTDKAVAIEVLPAHPAAQADVRWLHALRALAVRRPRLPVNGIALCLSALSLQGEPDERDALFDEMARRANLVCRMTRLRLPFYVLVTDVDRLPGFDAFLQALPEAAFEQALGCRIAREDSTLPYDDERIADLLNAAFEPIEERLESLRLGVLMHATGVQARLDMHRFVEAVAQLRPGLEELLARLSQETGDTSLFWRGLYLSASRPQPLFVHDVLTRLLPADQPLARATP